MAYLISLMPQKKGVKFKEVAMPNRMKRWAVALSKLIAFLATDQEMANVFSKEFAEAAKKGPPFIHLVVSKVGGKP